jgi:multisubunit Na+/H+ antiporter MnhB subunit
VSLALGLDLLLMATVVVVAFRAIHVPGLFHGVVLYIAFGLLLSLVWVRLEAPDLALAEAAIGAGITGAMLLDAAGQLSGRRRPWTHVRGHARLAAGLAALGVGLALALAFTSLADRAPGLREVVHARLPSSGVDHPVTAVLLNFRGYDTWLEVGVLLVAGLAILALRRSRVVDPRAAGGGGVEEITSGAVGILVPFGLLAGGYLLWRGTHAPGGAFQAGAVVGAMGILLLMVRRLPARLFRERPMRLFLVAGFGVFLLAGLAGPVAGGAFLEFPPEVAGTAILVIEAAVAVSVAFTLALLFAGGRPHADGGAEP